MEVGWVGLKSLGWFLVFQLRNRAFARLQKLVLRDNYYDFHVGHVALEVLWALHVTQWLPHLLHLSLQSIFLRLGGGWNSVSPESVFTWNLWEWPYLEIGSLTSNQVKMKLCWVWMGPKSNHWYLYKEREMQRDGRDRTQGKVMWVQRQRLELWYHKPVNAQTL